MGNYLKDFAGRAKSSSVKGLEVMELDDSVRKTVANDPSVVTGLLEQIAKGDMNGFLNTAEKIGMNKEQSRFAYRESAALASVIAQLGDVASW